MTTKTVEGYFGPKQVTREQFVTQWKDSFWQFFHLTNTTDEFKEFEVMRERIAVLAGMKWDNLKG